MGNDELLRGFCRRIDRARLVCVVQLASAARHAGMGLDQFRIAIELHTARSPCPRKQPHRTMLELMGYRQ